MSSWIYIWRKERASKPPSRLTRISVLGIICEQPQIIFAERAKGLNSICPALLVNSPPSIHSVMLFAPRPLFFILYTRAAAAARG